MKKLYIGMVLCLIIASAFSSIAGAQPSQIPPPVIPVTGVSVTPTTLGLFVGSTGNLTALVTPVNANNRDVTWSSSNTAVATVAALTTSVAVVTAVAPGTATITVTTVDGGFTDTCVVTVSVAASGPTGVSITPTSLDQVVDDEDTLTATVTPTSATNKNVTWSSSNTAVASVLATNSTDARVTAEAPGTAIITVTTVEGGLTDTCVVTVRAEASDPSGVSLSLSSLGLVDGTSDTLRATVIPAGGDVTWSSSNSNVATVTPINSTDARVTAVGPGTAIITVTTDEGGYTATSVVTVHPEEPTATPSTDGSLMVTYLIVTGFMLLVTAITVIRVKRKTI